MHPTPHERSGLTLEAPPKIACKNCGTPFAGRYCNHCGQRADTHRITWHYIWHEIPHSVWHVDKGILFTLKELFIRPGYTIREFLDGKRVNHYRPLALVLVLGTVLTFLVHSLQVDMMEETQKAMREVTGLGEGGSQRVQAFQAEVNAFAEKYRNLIQIFFLPVTSLFTWWFFRKKGLNYPEHLVTNTFLMNFSLVVSIGTILLFKAVGGSTAAYSLVQSLGMLVALAYTMWAFVQLFRGRVKPWSAALRAAGASLASMVAVIVLAMLVGIGYALFVLVPEAKKQKEVQRTTPAVHAPLPKK
ncbi:MAG: DUF3667 domain-containing protein [Sphingobacteriaceae bacterium]|nr:DUF3667 domain-containing protein [Cytophagaceae bacterium]